jgi:hypothetical protein
MVGLSFACRLFATFSLACSLHAKLFALTLCLRALLGLRLPFRRGHSAALGLLLSLPVSKLSQIAVDAHFF